MTVQLSHGPAILAAAILLSPACLAQQCRAPNISLPEAGYKSDVRSAVSAPGAQLSATNENSSVSLKLSSEPCTRLAPRVDQPGFATWSNWSVTAEAPLKKDQKQHDLLHQDGWGNSTSVGVHYVTFFTRQPAKNKAASDKYCVIGKEARFNIEKAQPNQATSEADLRKKIEAEGCLVDNIIKYVPELLEAVRAADGYPDAGGILLGVSGAMEFHNSKYYAPDTLAKSEENNRPWSLAVTAGWNPQRAEKLFLLLRAEHKRSYEDAEEQTRCPVGGTAPTVVCVTGSFAPPAFSKSNVVSFETRYLFDKFAIAAIVSRNLSKNRTTVEVPLYLFGNDKMPLNGGLRLGWNSEDKDLSAGVFIGMPFSFF